MNQVVDTAHGSGDRIDAGLPEVQQEARTWLIENNRSDIKTIAGFAALLFVLCLPVQAWWGVVLGACVLAVVPNRILVARYYEQNRIERGLLQSNAGSWAIAFPIVAIVPDALGISLILLVGPLVLAASYFGDRLMRILIPIGLVLGSLLSVIGLTAEGANLHEFMPWPVYVAGMVVYSVSQVYLILSDVREAHAVRMRLLVRAAALNTDLESSQIALRDSRRRLVLAADGERGRIERDLHDGAQQRLVVLSIQLRLAAELADEGAAVSSAQLRQLGDDAATALQELRELAHGVYPARLHDLGVVASLRNMTQMSLVPVEIIDGSGVELPEAERLATYFICLEAIQNATKHGSVETAVTVRFGTQDGELEVEISDNGPGFSVEETTSSYGLTNMQDRAAAIGGALVLDSKPGHGTTVRLTLPITPTAVTA